MTPHRARQADPRHDFVESFNGRMRDELLNETLRFTIGQTRAGLACRTTSTANEGVALQKDLRLSLAKGFRPPR